MSKKLRITVGCVVVVGLSLVAGYKHIGPILFDDSDDPTTGFRPVDPWDAAPNPPVNVDPKDTNPNRNHDGWPVLVEAAYRGDLAEVKALIDLGADVNIKGPNDWTALHQAAGNGHDDVLQVLIDAGAYIHGENKSWHNARDIAEERGYEDIAQSLYEQGVADDRVREFITLTVMGVEKQVHNWIDKGHDPNRVDHKGRSALFYALCTDWDSRYSSRQFMFRPEIIELLLESGADPNLIDANGKTPTIALITEYSLNTEIFDLLREHGAKLDVIDIHNRSLLHYVQASSLIPDLIKLGLDVNQEDVFGLVPLHYHAQALNASAIQLLLDRGADPDATDSEGRKPIDLLPTEPKPETRGYERWQTTYDTLQRATRPTAKPG